MRSFAPRAALAAVFVSTSLAGAFAGPQYSSALPQVHHASTQATSVYKPRLEQVMREIHAADRRIERDHRAGHLNVAEYRKLEGRSSEIRKSAEHLARLHDGAIPNASYQNLQQRIAELNHSIQAYSKRA